MEKRKEKRKGLKQLMINKGCVFFASICISVRLLSPGRRWAGQGSFFLEIQSRSKALGTADGLPHSPKPIPARFLLHFLHFQCLICSFFILILWKSFSFLFFFIFVVLFRGRLSWAQCLILFCRLMCLWEVMVGITLAGPCSCWMSSFLRLDSVQNDLFCF